MTTEPKLYTTVDRSVKYTEDSFKPYLDGKLPVPNFEPKEPAPILNALACSQPTPLRGRLLNPLKPQETYASWGVIYPFTTQGGGYTGQGYVVIWGYNGVPICGNFSICKHSTKLLPGANPSRGLHDQFCEKCGLDLSYDSSD